MKKLIELLMLLLVLSGCAERKADGSWEIDKNLKKEGVTHGPFIEIIDSCEYVIWGVYQMAHKGNCKFCAARRDVIPGPPVEDYGEDEEY